VSGVLVLAESHISIHTWPERDFASIDIFMCGACDPYDSLPALKAAFSRQNGQSERAAARPDRLNRGTHEPTATAWALSRPFRLMETGDDHRYLAQRNALSRLGPALPGEARTGAGAERLQDIVIFESFSHGRVMVLDGVIQITEADEFVYQEMLAHVPLLAHGAAANVLIIGAGDGGVLRRVLQHGSVGAP
jgi:hypothetical protein